MSPASIFVWMAVRSPDNRRFYYKKTRPRGAFLFGVIRFMPLSFNLHKSNNSAGEE